MATPTSPTGNTTTNASNDTTGVTTVTTNPTDTTGYTAPTGPTGGSHTTDTTGLTSNPNAQEATPSKSSKIVKKKICDCAHHEKKKWPYKGEIEIPKCAKRCPYCVYEPVNQSTWGSGSIIRKHIKTSHIGSKRIDLFKGLRVLDGGKGKGDHELEVAETDSEGEDSSDDSARSKSPETTIGPCKSCANKKHKACDRINHSCSHYYPPRKTRNNPTTTNESSATGTTGGASGAKGKGKGKAKA
ncbi:hypothetical protein DTO166G4_184 [Paecilomyces variotii]|nr:hypothetical protein DTO166G4_184 [Paecilomyces variotii]KAJ9227726.1 hypothetical protein DTO166G5_9228 [Paecilomyces variotii]